MAVGLLFRDKIKIKHRETPYINLHYLKNEERLCPREEDIFVLLTWTQSDEVLQRVWIYIWSLSVFFNSLKLEQ